MDDGTATDLAGAVERMQAGGNITGLARELKVSRWSLYRWKQVYEKQGPAGLALAGWEAVAIPPPSGRPTAASAPPLRWETSRAS
jgi:hypothetical protein